MWLSEQMRADPPFADAELGVTSIAGERVGVLTRGEVRALPVCGPGGYCWQPANGDLVLVIKGGTGGEERCVAGAKQKNAPAGMKPGEVYLYSAAGGSVYLKNDGSVELHGTIRLTGPVSVEGELTINGEPYVPCTCGAGGGT